MGPRLQMMLMTLVDAGFALLPQPRPAPAKLARCRVVSHRGEHDNRTVKENTLAAFRQARASGAWGVEADIRWTADLVPVIMHDPDGHRVFDVEARLADLEFSQLRQQMPDVPTLAELVEEFGGDRHLMLEIKAEHYPDPDRQAAILADCLAGLQAGRDYHFLALDTALFERVPFVPGSCCLPVAELNTRRMSDAAIEKQLGGLTGHYLLLNRRLQGRHEQAGQQVGTGFIRSRRSLYREVNRGAAWIFSNHAARLQRYLAQPSQGAGAGR
jgi:glycerophosphoryl diester phosphodiesterase